MPFVDDTIRHGVFSAVASSGGSYGRLLENSLFVIENAMTSTRAQETIELSVDQDWSQLIDEAINEQDPLIANFKITRCHYGLSAALAKAIGKNAGANFHSWGVWGSRKAGVTIRQEDKDQASRDAIIVASTVGALVGLVVGYLFASPLNLAIWMSIVLWMLMGAFVGGWCGLALARYTRREASRLVLHGNRIVLDDIGRATALYLRHVSESGKEGSFDQFSSQLRDGPTETEGQDLLKRAFQYYDKARLASVEETRHQAAYFANCLAILHEHIRLQPYISKSMPFFIRKCVTERLMTFSVGDEVLAVHEDVPAIDQEAFPPTLVDLKIAELNEFLNGTEGWDVARDDLRNTGASDWTKIKQRMGYIVNLFRSRHLLSEVTASPYSPEQMASIAAGKLPDRPW